MLDMRFETGHRFVKVSYLTSQYSHLSMNYYELLFTTITTEDYQQDLLIGALGDIGFDTFEEVDLGFKAYIPVDD
ncbi:MAG: ribosomal protein methyltransferase, partial [Mucilaginibacter sp.]|nr:ribosomal protein methyltransferase [Mucilaginibacter sp.]